MPNLLFDADEGTTVREVCCLACHEQVDAIVTLAIPAQMYGLALECKECEEPLVEFNAMTGRLIA